MPGFVGKVRGERVWTDFDGGQTDAADGDAVAQLQFLAQSGEEIVSLRLPLCCLMPATRPTSSIMPVNMMTPKCRQGVPPVRR